MCRNGLGRMSATAYFMDHLLLVWRGIHITGDVPGARAPPERRAPARARTLRRPARRRARRRARTRTPPRRLAAARRGGRAARLYAGRAPRQDPAARHPRLDDEQ